VRALISAIDFGPLQYRLPTIRNRLDREMRWQRSSRQQRSRQSTTQYGSVLNIGGRVQRAGTIDFVAQCAYPLSSLVISNLLGLPAEYHQIFREASAAIARFPTSVLQGDFAQVVHSAVCLKQAETVLENLICQRRATPGADLISRLQMRAMRPYDCRMTKSSYFAAS
jgi:cytochrome P450